MSRKIIGVTVGTAISPAKVEKEIKPVKSVNGVAPDENGNVEITIPDSTYYVHVEPDGDGGYFTDSVMDDILQACTSDAPVICRLELPMEPDNLQLPLAKHDDSTAYFSTVFEGKEYLVTINADGVTVEISECGGGNSGGNAEQVTLPDNLVYYMPDSGDDTGEEESGTVSGSTVAVTQVLTSGVEIAKISVDGEETTLYAPEASSGGGGSGGESAGIPGFTKVFSTTTTEEVGTITTDIDLSQYSEVFGFIRTLPADSTKSGHVVWTFDKSSNYAHIGNSLNSTQERMHIIHLTKYASNLWCGDVGYKIHGSNTGDKIEPCMVETSKIGSVGSWLGDIALKIGTTVEIYVR